MKEYGTDVWKWNERSVRGRVVLLGRMNGLRSVDGVNEAFMLASPLMERQELVNVRSESEHK